MKRRVLSLLLAALLLASLLLLTGCHGSRERSAFSVPESFDSSRTYEVTFWAKNDTNKTQTAIYEKAMADFEALYPNIDVTMRLYTDYGRIYNDVITNIATNTTPNVCITYPDHIATYLTGMDVVVPLDELFADPRFGFGGSELLFDSPAQDELIDSFMDECLIGGVHYAIPFHRGLLCQQDLCGEARLHPARGPDLGLRVGGVRGRNEKGRGRQLRSQRPEGHDPLHL